MDPRRFITAFTTACHLSLSWASYIQSILPPSPSHFLKIHLNQRVSPGPKQIYPFRNTAIFIMVKVFSTSPNHQAGGHTPCRPAATAYSIYAQLLSISEAVPPSTTWGRAMLWWQGPTYRAVDNTCIFWRFADRASQYTSIYLSI